MQSHCTGVVIMGDNNLSVSWLIWQHTNPCWVIRCQILYEAPNEDWNHNSLVTVSKTSLTIAPYWLLAGSFMTYQYLVGHLMSNSVWCNQCGSNSLVNANQTSLVNHYFMQRCPIREKNSVLRSSYQQQRGRILESWKSWRESNEDANHVKNIH